ncbi:hypothetical protein ACEN4E_11640 [Latilactobacillus sakei]|uniref:hypothetical protein n=1 Tax=Latilactobacillus sakei TaxID=1599 RepID=UPI0025B5FDE9|nr:hypothetical protein [Latilactobacillus sakei]MDN4010801.1 hypothetical protein [Latilactobacillus sakei]
MNKLKEQLNKHPYRSLLIIVSISSFVGILGEYVVNGNFIKSGFYGTLIFVVIQLIIFKLQKK